MNPTVNYNFEAITDKWYLCKANFLPEIRTKWHIPNTVKIADCTLRDGEQQAGITLTVEDKVAIARQLDKLGVHEIEVGTPASSDTDREAARQIVALDLKRSKITALARAKKEDIDLLVQLGVWGANISMPIGDLQREVKLKIKTKEEYIDKCLEITSYARSKGLHVNLSPYDTTRCDIAFLLDVLKVVSASGNIDRIRLVDSVGSASPDGITYMVKNMKKIMGNIPLEIHVHNDFGLAMANTLAAVCAGADVVSCTMNGIGERSGNAATEEIILTLQMIYGVDLGIDCSVLKATSELVERLTNVHIAKNKAVVGTNCFAHESGLAVAGMLKGCSFNSEPYLPELVGQKTIYVLGKKSGKKSVEMMLEKFNIPYTAEQVERLLSEVKTFAVTNKRALGDTDFIALVKKVIH